MVRNTKNRCLIVSVMQFVTSTWVNAECTIAHMVIRIIKLSPFSKPMHLLYNLLMQLANVIGLCMLPWNRSTQQSKQSLSDYSFISHYRCALASCMTLENGIKRMQVHYSCCTWLWIHLDDWVKWKKAKQKKQKQNKNMAYCLSEILRADGSVVAFPSCMFVAMCWHFEHFAEDACSLSARLCLISIHLHPFTRGSCPVSCSWPLGRSTGAEV